ncbi:MAG: hypothetical protein UT09_C0006G0030 [Parcubacteria group bacterium GW2011_GWF2_38_8]|nr:MAG: hypothetical protein UT09_C0006G0030 [Parcubacteria group bacterium GW2011_GWF2_38_8]
MLKGIGLISRFLYLCNNRPEREKGLYKKLLKRLLKK